MTRKGSLRSLVESALTHNWQSLDDISDKTDIKAWRALGAVAYLVRLKIAEREHTPTNKKGDKKKEWGVQRYRKVRGNR
ncbi:MAG: hypothetical protein M0Q91_16820 [Methanoregula sp.]|nr:hypothetical protein [Methanoregula sp.]